MENLICKIPGVVLTKWYIVQVYRWLLTFEVYKVGRSM